MMFGAELLGLLGSTVQTAIAAALLIALFAPRLLPPLGRLAGRLLAHEMRRRLGFDTPPPRAPRPRGPGEEVLPPDAPAPTLRAGHSDSLAPHSDREPAHHPRARSGTPVLVLLVAATGAAVLLWFLLHQR